MTIKISGTGIGLPKLQLSNDELAELAQLDTSDEWIVSRTGIHSRYVCVDETLTDLATTAARAALDDAGLAAADIGYLICATIGGETRTPSLACAVAERLGVDCAALDLNAACAGFIYALDMAACLIGAGRAGHVLIISAEKMSGLVDWHDRSTCVLFGDGAAACVVSPGHALAWLNVLTQPDSAVITLPANTTGNSPFAPRPNEQGFVQMDGQKVFKYAVTLLEREVARALAALDLTADEIDYYVIHQANKRIIDFAISRLGLAPAKFPLNIERYGNISAVSIPLLLHEMKAAGQIHPGDKLFMCAFGAGMTCGSCVLDWE